jgi:hypothetical protein
MSNVDPVDDIWGTQNLADRIKVDLNSASGMYKAMRNKKNGLRLRMATVVSVQSAYSITVQVAGSSQSLPGVRYFSNFPPKPNDQVWLVTDGGDILALGMVAAAGRVLAPRVFSSIDISLTNATDTAITFNTANNDAYAMWSASTPTRLTCVVPGRYQFTGFVRFAANATGLRAIWVQRAGTQILGRQTTLAASGSIATYMTVTTATMDFAQGDYVELYARQESGGALNVTAGDLAHISLSAVYLGPGN